MNASTVTQRKSTLPTVSLKRIQKQCAEVDSARVSIQVPMKRRRLVRRNCVADDEHLTSHTSKASGSSVVTNFAVSRQATSSALPRSPALERIDDHDHNTDLHRSMHRNPHRSERRRFKRRNSKVGRMFYENDSCTLLYLTSVSQSLNARKGDKDGDLYEEVVKKMQSSLHFA